MKKSDYFAILGLSPTMDAARIKRAYFAALQRHPPHADAEEFRQVREAYERLASPEGRLGAYLDAPIDVDAAAAPFESVAAALTRIAAQRLETETAAAKRAATIEALSRATLAEVSQIWRNQSP